MSTSIFYLCIGCTLWVLALHSLLLNQHILRKIITVNVMGSGVFLVMVALAARIQNADPILHALVVTGLVVAVSATAFALRLASTIAESQPEKEPPENKP